MSTQSVDIHAPLIEACKQGDAKAQYEVYRLYVKAMLNTSMRIMNDFAEAEDVLQEAFVEAFTKIHTFKGEASFGSWLKRIVINRSLNQLKKRRIQWVNIENFDFEEENEDIYEQDLQIQKVHQAIQQLPDGFRTVITLYLLEEYSHKEIAQALNITESTSKSQLNRAKAKLKEILKKN